MQNENKLSAGLAMMPWFPGDFLKSTRGWPLVARGVYRELLDAQWDMGFLPIAQADLQRIACCTDEEWAVAWPKVESKLPQVNKDQRMNVRLEDHRRHSQGIREVRSETGRKGGLARAKAQAIAKANAQPKPVAKPQANSNPQAPAQAQAPNQAPAQTKSAERAAPLVLHESLPQIPWREWLEWRRKRRWPCDPVTLQKHLNLLKQFDSTTQSSIIDTSINANWQGLFAPKGRVATKEPYKPPRTVAQMERDEEANRGR